MGKTASLANIGTIADSSLGFRNRIINGAMMIDQRNAGASVTPVGGNYLVDRFMFGSLSQASKISAQQSTVAPSGFTNSTLITSLSSYSVVSSDVFEYGQRIEGFNYADLMYGTANAQTVTLSFWVRSSLTGTFGGRLANSAQDYTYPFSYSISSANTWEQKSITITGPTAGTWIGATNGIGLRLFFSLGAGSTYLGTAGSWTTGDYRGVTGQTNLVGTNGATFYITGVQLEKGSTATSFDYRPYGTELALCQRYFYKHQNTNGGASYPMMLQAYSTTAAFGKICDLPVTMRTNPTSSTTATSGTFTPSAANGTAAGAFTATVIETSTVNALCTGAWTGSSGLVAGNVTTVSMPNNAFFSASAEL